MKATLHPTELAVEDAYKPKRGLIASLACVLQNALFSPSVTRVTQTEHHETHFSS